MSNAPLYITRTDYSGTWSVSYEEPNTWNAVETKYIKLEFHEYKVRNLEDQIRILKDMIK